MPNVTVTATDTLSPGDFLVGSFGSGSLQGPGRFPLALVKPGDLLNYSNNFPSYVTPTLAGGMLPTDLTISLASGTGAQFPNDVFEVSIDNEIIFVTSRSGDTLNVVRGAENTTPNTHVIGATVQLLFTALAHNQVVSELVNIENFLGVRGANITTAFPTEVSVTAVNPGDFSVAHGLGKTPKYAFIQMTSDGLIRFQTSRYDATNLYLNASDANLTCFVEVFG